MSTRESEAIAAEWMAALPPKQLEPKDCRHLEFSACCAIARIEDSGKFYAELRVVCLHCHEPMRFVGLSPGLDPSRPTCSIDGLEANLPIEPEVEKRLFTGARYIVDKPPERRH